MGKYRVHRPNLAARLENADFCRASARNADREWRVDKCLARLYKRDGMWFLESVYAGSSEEFKPTPIHTRLRVAVVTAELLYG